LHLKEHKRCKHPKNKNAEILLLLRSTKGMVGNDFGWCSAHGPEWFLRSFSVPPNVQAGTSTAIGFPLQEQEAPDSFYEFSNWMCQAGVFVSRSSGTFCTAPTWVLWLTPAL
jgi:hypothetical protein